MCLLHFRVLNIAPTGTGHAAQHPCFFCCDANTPLVFTIYNEYHISKQLTLKMSIVAPCQQYSSAVPPLHRLGRTLHMVLLLSRSFFALPYQKPKCLLKRRLPVEWCAQTSHGFFFFVMRMPSTVQVLQFHNYEYRILRSANISLSVTFRTLIFYFCKSIQNHPCLHHNASKNPLFLQPLIVCFSFFSLPLFFMYL